MRKESRNQLLKGVSRSFYLTLRLLPKPMRDAATLGYLLARTSDTLADSENAPAAARLLCLDYFAEAVAGDSEAPRWPYLILNATADRRERELLERTREVLDWLRALPETEAALVREVLETIIGGQRLDLERFEEATPGNPVILPDAAALEDYTWRVAGCVGAFWTKLGFLTMGSRFSTAPQDELLERGIRYGKGLQLVNILRDLPVDLANGRCYLPVGNPADHGELLAAHAAWLAKAREWVAEGPIYADSLVSRMPRVATVLPAMIAEETLDAIEGVTWERLQKRVKIPRRRIYMLLMRAILIG